MVVPIIFLIAVPLVLGIAYVHPLDQVEEPPQDVFSEEPDLSIPYLILTGIWIFFLLRIIIQVKKRTFKITHRY